MATPVYFSARMTSTQTNLISYPFALVALDQVATASAHSWDLTTNSMTVAYRGAYFISLTIAVILLFVSINVLLPVTFCLTMFLIQLLLDVFNAKIHNVIDFTGFVRGTL
jgi:diacylglycerol kinase